ncbi:MAG: energy-coupling factor transporter ATPase [Ruminococcaceae bacterium]|nr:energy-coupling factor transporter ATPase [Oscillospiraceae bacterium]
MAEISLREVSFRHGKGTPYEICALDKITLDIAPGVITGIIGHTGSGKSTLVELFNGILKPAEGRVLIDGEDIWAKPKEIRKVRFRVGLVMQYPESQLFEETIRQDIAFGPKNMGLSDKEIERRVVEAARFVGLDEELLEKSPFDLSGGQKRRAAIAGIIAMRPDVLVLDEPAAGLDPVGRESIFANIVEYKEKTGSTVVIVSHSMEDMARYCDRVVVMSGGKMIMNGSRDEVFSQSASLEGAGLDIPQITKLMTLLRDRGIDVDQSIYTSEKAYEEIMKLFAKKG